MNSIINWAGGKRWQIPLVASRWEHVARPMRLVEPFCGGLSIALGLQPKRALLNDANPHLINFWLRVMRGQLDPHYVAETYKDPQAYFAVRACFNQQTPDTLLASELFYVLNHWAFNGLWRVNAKGAFNVPPRPSCKPLPTYDPKAYRDAMVEWDFTCGDFDSVPLEPGDFVYADPPYDDGFNAYNADGFSWTDQQRLATWLSTHDGPVVVTNKATERIQHLYVSLGYRVELLDAPQRMHQSQGRSDKILEIFATRNC